MAIPISMLYIFLKRGKKLPFPHLWWLYVTFIVTCGLTHLIEAIVSYHPIERFAGLMKAITAIASWVTVFSLWRIMPLALNMKTPNEMESQVADRTQQLEEALARQEALTKELKQREEELAERDRQRTNFLAMLAHELRNPLAPVRTTIHLIKEKYAHCLDARYLEMDEMINRQLNHLSRMIDDLLDVARIKHGKIKLVMEASSVAKAIDGTMAVLDSHKTVKHKIHVTCPQDLFVLADSTRLEQIFTNILTNAIKYSPEGSNIYINAFDIGEGKISITIKDEGKGIGAADLPKIYDMFYQVEQSIDRANGGLGIGLTIVKKLIDLHGGKIDVESHIGIGTTFTIIFPSVAQEHVVIPRHKTGNKRILIVEDNRDAAHSLSILFKDNGSEVRVCHDGNSAVVTANLFDPDVVILDIGLPGLSGFDVARALRSSTVTENVRIVAVSGYSREEDVKAAEAAGVNDYMVKPADVRKLLKVVLDKA